jgi:hypothetical protein
MRNSFAAQAMRNSFVAVGAVLLSVSITGAADVPRMEGFLIAEEKCPECVRLLEKPFSMVELCAYLEEILTGPSRT